MAGVSPIRWSDWLPFPWRKWRVVGEVAAGDEIPQRLPPKGAILVGGSHPTWLAFDCPCNRGHRIMVNLDRTRRPRWAVTTRTPLTLRPSVDGMTSVGRCHFVLREGNVIWIAENERERSDWSFDEEG